MDKRDTGAAIREIQKYLRALSNSGMPIKKVKTDGVYGQSTEQAVRDFQRLFGIPVTGEIDLVTWNILFDEYSNVRLDCSGPMPLYCFGNECCKKGLKKGDKGNAVYIIQIMLENYTSFVDVEELQTINGIFDSETEENIRHFQNTHSLPVTGEMDMKTWNSLADFYNNNRLTM